MVAQEPLSSQDIERSVIKKILTRLVPFLSFLYAFNLMDRGNISIAALTMKTDLHLSDRMGLIAIDWSLAREAWVFRFLASEPKFLAFSGASEAIESQCSTRRVQCRRLIPAVRWAMR